MWPVRKAEETEIRTHTREEDILPYEAGNETRFTDKQLGTKKNNNSVFKLNSSVVSSFHLCSFPVIDSTEAHSRLAQGILQPKAKKLSTPSRYIVLEVRSIILALE